MSEPSEKPLPPGMPLPDTQERRQAATCRKCGAPIYWIGFDNGSLMAIDRGRECRVALIDGSWRVVGAFQVHQLKCGLHKGRRG